MSQASKQLDWCLSKAEKEIEECKRLGKRPKHRGILKIKPSIKDAKEHIEKAEHDIQVTEYLKEGKFLDVGISTVFYSMYHCFLAIAAKFGYESGNQTCTIVLIENLIEEGKINLDKKFINMLRYKDNSEEKDDGIIEMREDYTYNTKLSFNEAKIDELIETSKELIDLTKEIVFK